MRVVPLMLVVVSAVPFAAGCASADADGAAARPSHGLARGVAADERRLVRSGEIVVAVDSPEETAARVRDLVAAAQGRVESTSTTEDARAWLQCRVPAAQLDRTMDAVAGLGSTTRRAVAEADVTDEWTDVETRLRNDAALRDRLRDLLSRADDVEDVLAIEKELNRIQSEIESRQARMERLRTDVELSPLSVELRREPSLGPLGWIGAGVWWLVSKLFVLD